MGCLIYFSVSVNANTLKYLAAQKIYFCIAGWEINKASKFENCKFFFLRKLPISITNITNFINKCELNFEKVKEILEKEMFYDAIL